MSDEAALIAGIREHPLDDLRRLVYADWLDERGRTEQAEYLRLVAALAAPQVQIDPEHLLTLRLMAVAKRLREEWKAAVGSRFALWLDGYAFTARNKLDYTQRVAECMEIDYEGAKGFCESLPRLFERAGPLEEVVPVVHRIGSLGACRILPTYGPLPVGEWLRSVEIKSLLLMRASHPDQTLVMVDHLRRLLAGHPESAALVPLVTPPCESSVRKCSVILSTGHTWGEAIRRARLWRSRLFGERERFDGRTANPPFNGWIFTQTTALGRPPSNA